MSAPSPLKRKPSRPSVTISLPPDKSKQGRNNRLRGRLYEAVVAKKLQLVWPNARRVERSGASRYKKGDIEDTPPIHWSVKSGLSLDWRTALGEAVLEVATRPELAGMTPGAVLVDRRGPRLGYYVVLKLDDFVELLAEYADLNRLNKEGSGES